MNVLAIRQRISPGARLLAIGVVIISCSRAWGDGDRLPSKTEQSPKAKKALQVPQAETPGDSPIPHFKEFLTARLLIERSELVKANAGLSYARELVESAVKIVREASGPESGEYGICLGRLGNIDLEMYRFGDAIAELEQAQKIMRRNQQDFRFLVLIAVDCNLAFAHRKNNDLVIAETLYKNVINEMHSKGHYNDVEYSIALISLANVYLDGGAKEKAFNYLSDAQTAVGNKPDEDSSVVACLKAGFGRYYFLKKDFAESNSLYRDALAASNKATHQDMSSYAQMLVEYSRSLLDQARYDDATTVLNDKRAEIQKCLGAEHPLVVEIDSSINKADSLSKEHSR